MANSSAPKLTKAALQETTATYNGCPMKTFLEKMDDESRSVLEEALAMKPRELGAPRLRQMLIDAGYKDADLPTLPQIQNHRSRREGCKCPR